MFLWQTTRTNVVDFVYALDDRFQEQLNQRLNNDSFPPEFLSATCVGIAESQKRASLRSHFWTTSCERNNAYAAFCEFEMLNSWEHVYVGVLRWCP